MMYQCGRCGLTRASSQEPMGLVMPQCKCPWEFVPPVAPQRIWVGLTDLENAEFVKTMERGNFLVAIYDIEKRLKEKNT